MIQSLKKVFQRYMWIIIRSNGHVDFIIINILMLPNISNDVILAKKNGLICLKYPNEYVLKTTAYYFVFLQPYKFIRTLLAENRLKIFKKIA